jgi:hypothetical protein
MPHTNKKKRSDYNKRYRETHREKINAYNKKRYAADPTAQKIASKKWTIRNWDRVKKYARDWQRRNRSKRYDRSTEVGFRRLRTENARKRNARQLLKTELLTHYGGGQLRCCWDNCPITDIDMLTIDHVDNSGAEHRRQAGSYGKATKLYANLKKRGFPSGFQTLCANHQIKKEILRKREIWRQLDERALIAIELRR